MRKNLIILLACLVIVLGACTPDSVKTTDSQPQPRLEENTITNLYDAFGEDREGLLKDFGFSCMIRYDGKTILFDGGTNADIFKNNVEHLDIDLSEIDFVVASHAHFDHINGFDYLLEVNPKVKIYFPYDVYWGANFGFDLSGKDPSVADSLETRMQYFGGDYQDFQLSQSGRFWKSNIEFVQESQEIEPGINLVATTSPHMGYFNKYPSLNECEDCEPSEARLNGLNELSLSLNTDNGEILFVGCSHSTVEKIIVETKKYTNNDIELVYGGYHLLPYNKPVLTDLALRLKNDLKVNKVAPAHCTGHLAFKVLQDHFQDNYVFAGLGETVTF